MSTTDTKGTAAYTIAEFAKQWGVSERHVRNLIRDGEIPAVRLGQSHRIPVAALEDWIAAQLETTAA